IPISLKTPEKGEQKAQACVNALSPVGQPWLGCGRLSSGLKRFWQGAHFRVLTRDDPPFPCLLNHYQRSDRALVPFEKFAFAIGITSSHVGDGNVLPDEADLLDGKALVAFAEWPSEESGVNFDELITGGDPLTEHVDKVAILYPALIQG